MADERKVASATAQQELYHAVVTKCYCDIKFTVAVDIEKSEGPNHLTE